MSGNTFGNIFKVTTFGESHGVALGLIIDGCPAGFPVDLDNINHEMARRRPGQSSIVTQRKEPDHVEILSGVFDGLTTGTPIGMLIKNKDAKSKDYDHIKDKFRPSHADYTFHAKYGIRDYRGGGRSSARETAARVAAGALAKQYLAAKNIKIQAYVSQVGSLQLKLPLHQLDLSRTETNPVRCPDPDTAQAMEELIRQVRKDGDTIGGIVSAVITGCPAGLGEPVFAKLHAALGQAMLSINACKGFDYGSGFAGILMRGSQHNDVFKKVNGKVITNTNHSGGIQGGISNGMDINFRCAFKPVATIIAKQSSIDTDGNPTQITGKGRHDPCVLPRAVPIVEAMAALVVMDFLLMQRSAQW